MKRILSIFLAVVFAISLAGFASAESNQSIHLTAQAETPAPMVETTPAPKKHHKKHHHHKKAPKPTPASEAPAPETNPAPAPETK